MARRSRNPIGFTPLPVSFFTAVIYIGAFAALLITHHVLPPAPSSPTPTRWPGVNITEAWLDLERLSSEFHPFNSRSNIGVRHWLLNRVEEILDGNNAEWKKATGKGQRATSVTVFDDRTSNVTFADARGTTVYYESTNILVYLRGAQDPEGDWWKTSTYEGSGGVLVNAHYDSVSTGYGATDDGVGVITVLQLLSHFTKRDGQPERGILFLLNNGEEDGLYGAKAFTRDPLSQFPRAFLNLEGAGAGGRATLFRSTDTEVTKFYSKSPYPFGSIVSGDGFKRGLVRSGTDYSVFTDDLGMRGLDVAFMEPRARYHTSQDDARDSSVESLWHMLSAALTTVSGLSDDTSSLFDRTSGDNDSKVNAGKGSDGVWFDLFGRAFAVLQLHTLFALSVTLLVAGPILLIIIEVILQKNDKWYLFARKKYLHSSDDDEPVKLLGWKGFFRFPLVFVVTGAVVVALAYLLTKVNPHIVYSSEYAVWSMMLAAWFSTAWFFLRLGDSIRPSALSRAYVLLWLYALSWVALVAATIGEHQLHLGSGYFIIVYNAAIFVALLISYFDFFALPKKSAYAEQTAYEPDAVDGTPARSGSLQSNALEREESPRGREGRTTNANENEDADERTSLLGSRQTFTRHGRDRRRSEQSDENTTLAQTTPESDAYDGEQAWSSSLPRWTWLLQFLILAPINIILLGQVSLLMTSALHQTPADGSSVLLVYILMAVMSVLLLLPLAPFLHRLTYHIPTFIFFVFVGTLIYNLVAFPFSRESKLKVFFIQQVDLDNGNNTAALTGLSPYLREIVSQLPSASHDIRCGQVDWASRNGLDSCTWAGLPPNVVPNSYVPKPSTPYPNSTLALQARKNAAAKHAKWIDFNITRPAHNASSGEYIFDIQGSNTRACRIYFDTPFSNITISGSGPDGQNFSAPEDEKLAKRIGLWSRDWDARWRVHVSFDRTSAFSKKENSTSHIDGKVVCIWSDANQIGTIPALDEIKHYMPVWSAVTKNNDGLVEGYKRFRL